MGKIVYGLFLCVRCEAFQAAKAAIQSFFEIRGVTIAGDRPLSC